MYEIKLYLCNLDGVCLSREGRSPERRRHTPSRTQNKEIICRKGDLQMSKHLNPLEKEFLIHKYKENQTVKMRDFCLVNSVSEASLKKWIKQYAAAGLAGLARADAETADVFPEGVEMNEEAYKREILRLRIENERLKKNYMVIEGKDGEMEYIRLRPKNSK